MPVHDSQPDLQDIAHQLLDLQRRAGEIAGALLRLCHETAPPAPSHTATARVRELFRAHPDRVFTLADVTRALPNVSRQTVRATVGRFCREGDVVETVSRGRYRLARR
jgi:hypothetical protein